MLTRRGSFSSIQLRRPKRRPGTVPPEMLELATRPLVMLLPVTTITAEVREEEVVEAEAVAVGKTRTPRSHSVRVFTWRKVLFLTLTYSLRSLQLCSTTRFSPDLPRTVETPMVRSRVSRPPTTS